MARIKIRGRKEAIEIDNMRARHIKALRFGNADGTGKADPHDDLDLGDEWAGMIGQVDWVELDRPKSASAFKIIGKTNVVGTVFKVPLNYALQAGEFLIN